MDSSALGAPDTDVNRHSFGLCHEYLWRLFIISREEPRPQSFPLFLLDIELRR